MRIRAGDIASLLEADLYQAGWDGATAPYPDITIRQFAMQSLRKAIVKKYLEGALDVSPDATAAAIAKFKIVNEQCRTYVSQTSTLPDWVRVALGEAKCFLWDFFYPHSHQQHRWDGQDFILSQREIAKGFGVGPGATIGTKGTDLYSKLALSTLDGTDLALHKLYVQAISSNATWAGLESCRSSRFGERVSASSRLSVVPKYAEIGRVICTEPLLNMIFQKGIGSVITRRLIETCSIDLKSQQRVNRHFARVGSLTGQFGTIDLTSASDSLSLAVVREFFPADVVKWLERTSCRTTVFPDGSTQELHMISSMGNGFTFPLQTVFFASLIYGAYKALGIPFIRSKAGSDGDFLLGDNFLPFKAPVGARYGNFAVNGDDLIVVEKAYNLVCECLAATGFTVNVEKSFNTGLFRESCGSDCYQGHEVRGVYIQKLRDSCDVYSAVNRLNRWSTQHRIPLNCLVSFLSRKARFLPVPYEEDDSHGVKVPASMLQRIRRDRNTGGIYYRVSVLKPNSVRVDNYELKRPRLPNWVLNPDGLMFAFIAGSIRDGFIGNRITHRKAVIRRRFSSRWDWICVTQAERPGFDKDWKVFVEANLLLVSQT